VDDLRDFIDSDEGYRDTDWDSHLRVPVPFFADALPCESCGRPVDCERKPAWWDGDLLVGPCCVDPLFDAIPANATCEDLFHAVMRCTSVQAVSLAMSVHIAECPQCASLRPEAPKIEPAYTVTADGTCVFPNRRKAA